MAHGVDANLSFNKTVIEKLAQNIIKERKVGRREAHQIIQQEFYPRIARDMQSLAGLFLEACKSGPVELDNLLARLETMVGVEGPPGEPIVVEWNDNE